ncbi:RNA 2',3'-cyclic phosphodiesterase [Candidatus Roizmanbacteria bacterium CG02_land_8_20_14_3_00_36_15]|uniref:RNA 2',3'-cyclic phosphodiesterase n=2 Tax=Candidatus Roizmaniibacteriota TaxID=1752723 RepID=A0A2M8KMP5_9BACT|nr:MAG: RNA 2',3'-cyclic phosphodiesterase [Candidatus Roizmanbacteria bacterium CG03_land_8_20_14_0_80_36_21]PIV38123.1 MAG: RNA 2',3'-cyclic phosphodiesterase [Candidatus Roizmanbacteria bacterium CG02_land_8_20_14_3_00_36_15]PIY70259.1 MAG: RNA 2',3'-cyclic phosphodiesterase [Candidatus Roizmanbacteria bacterium CG_4_10_14_0_8_um_filter_36_36]PJA52487.1 MAG: RNA 2',3'-cyclic phosphodiesterase [Candidatus Roizmanbacteria bacterium CG_4_9_14_3_um_filter_36_11]PJC81744.1 MAG: RNA 2',3'-cyclic p
MRLFLAIDLPKKTKKELEDQLSEIKLEYPQFNWIPKENFHITLHFFGEVIQAEKLIERLKEQLFDKESFYLYSTNSDLFINAKIIIYLNFRKEKRLLKIEKVVGDKKGFIPHLTFARWRIPSKQQYFVLKKKFEKLAIDISFPVKKLVLFQTIPKGKYPLYKKLASFPLI